MRIENPGRFVVALAAMLFLGVTGCGGNPKPEAPMSILEWREATGVHAWAHHVEDGEFYVLKDAGVKLDLDAGTSRYVYNLQRYTLDTLEWSVELPVAVSGSVTVKIFEGEGEQRRITVLHKDGLTRTLMMFDQSGALLNQAEFSAYRADMALNDISGVPVVLVEQTTGSDTSDMATVYELVGKQLVQRAQLPKNYDMTLYAENGQWFVMSSSTLHSFNSQWQPRLMLDVSDEDQLGNLFASDDWVVVASRYEERLYYINRSSESVITRQDDGINALVGVDPVGNAYLHYRKPAGEYRVVKMDRAGTLLYESSTEYGWNARMEVTELQTGGLAVAAELYESDGGTTIHTSRVDILDDQGELVRGYTLAPHEVRRLSPGCVEWCKTTENDGYRIRKFFIQQDQAGEVTDIFGEGFKPHYHIGEIDMDQFDGAEEPITEN
ncbi:MAG: hypothetical protein R3208_06130 [Ketobacteraceae bacterium]|nr:hypothetical protein [Ketobacteraceae bacterium]